MRVLVLLCSALAASGQTVSGDRVLETEHPVRHISFTANGEMLAGLTGDGKLHVWNARSGARMRTVALEAGARLLAFSSDGRFFATAGGGVGPQLRRFETGEEIRSFPALANYRTHLALSTDGATLATGGRDKTVRLAEVSSGAEKLAIRGGLGGAMAMAISPDGKTIVVADSDTNLRAWSTKDGELLRLMDELPVATFAMAFSPDGRYLATGGVDRLVSLWDTRTWRLVRQIPGQPEMVSALAFSPDGRLLVTGGFNDISNREPTTILLRSIESGEVLRRIPSPHAVVTAVFSPDGKQFATTHRGNGVSLWAVPAINTSKPNSGTPSINK